MPVYIPKRFKKPPTDPAKLAQWRKLEVMKMRHKASPGDPKDKNSSIPPDQRLHVKLFVEDTEHIFWFRRTMGTGRALDLLVEQLKLKFPGNPPLKIRLISSGDENTYLQNDKLLADQVEDACSLVVSPSP